MLYEEILNYIGIWSSPIFFCISILYLYKQPYYLGGYLVFFAANELCNNILKTIIKENRPENHQVPESILDNNFGADKYGMPSHHAQSLFFSSIYLYLTKQVGWLFMIELWIIAITIYQRYHSNRHTMEQLVAGSLIGSINGYISYIATKQYIYHQSAFHNKMGL